MNNQITPYFTVSDASAFMDFMLFVFGAEVTRRDLYDDGSIQHARLKLGDSVIMLNEANSAYLAMKSQTHVYVWDVHKTNELALAQGAKSLMLPMVRPHGDLMAGFEDPFGNVWWVAQEV